MANVGGSGWVVTLTETYTRVVTRVFESRDAAEAWYLHGRADLEAAPDELRLERRSGTIVGPDTGVRTAAGPSRRELRILGALDSDDPMLIEDWAAAAGVAKSSAFRWARRLVDGGLVEHVAAGLYELTDEGRRLVGS
jgi:hypothetical protein